MKGKETNPEPRTHEIDEEARALFSPHALLDAIHRFLTRGYAVVDHRFITDGARIARMIARLEQIHPDGPNQLISRLKGRTDRLRRLLPDFPRPLVEKLVFLAIGDLGELSRSVKNFSGRAADKKHFYIELLLLLLSDRPVDLEKLANAAPREKNDPPEEPDEDRIHPDRIPARLIRRLAEGAPAGRSLARMTRQLRMLAERRPETLRELIYRLAMDKTMFHRLLLASPPGLLLAALAPGPGGRGAGSLARRIDAIVACIRAFREHNRFPEEPYAALRNESAAGGREKVNEALAVREEGPSGAFEPGEKIGQFTQTLAARPATDHPEAFAAEIAGKAETAMKNAGVAHARQEYPSPAPPRRPETSRPEVASTRRPPSEERDFMEEIYISNAGMVLASPWLPRLMSMLGFVKDGRFKDRDASERAIHILQYMVDERTDAPEYQLVLNKILCGFETGVPITRSIDITDVEKEVVDGLVGSMIQQWKILKNTSVGGFRESFLIREGRLLLKESGWELEVTPKAFDMLLDQIPWGFSVIKHAWMKKAVYVKWR